MKKEDIYSGMTFGDLLLVTFIVMKLTGVIDWSWWWVLAPLWMPLALCVIMIIIVLCWNQWV